MTRTAALTFFPAILTAGILAGCGGCGGNKTTPVEVVISLDKTATALKSANITVDYSQSGATPLMSDGVPACISILPNVHCAFADDGAGTLTISAKAQTSFSAPVDLAVCRMVPDSAEVGAAQIASRLKVGLAGAIAKDGKVLDQKRLASTRGAGRKSPRGGSSGADGTAAGSGRDPVKPGAADNKVAADSDPAAEKSAVSGMKVDRDDLAAREARRQAEREASADRASENDAVRAARERAEAQAEADRAALEDDAALEDEDEDTNDPEDSQPVASYDVVLTVTSDSGPVSALQFDVNHLGSSGGWQGAGSKANCRQLASVNMNTCNDKGRGRITCAMVDLGGFPTPTDILSCVFKSADEVGIGDFSVQVIDASDPDMGVIQVDVAITAVTLR
jgi:hypothetical protein